MTLKALGLLLVGCLVDVSAGAAVVHLNDGNFEHDTQAATGATTGDWLVIWGNSPQQQIAERVARIAEERMDRYSVGFVHLENSPELKERFQVSHLAVLYFTKGVYYRHTAPERALSGDTSGEALRGWASKGYLQHQKTPVPPEPKLLDRVMSFPKYIHKEIAKIIGVPGAFALEAALCLVTALLGSLLTGVLNRRQRAAQKRKSV